MIKVSVFYPYSEGATFDMNYYLEKHIPLCQNIIGDALISCHVDQGIDGMMPGSCPTFATMCHLVFDLPLEDVKPFFASPTMASDVPNFTNIQPVLQVSEVKKQ